MTFITIPQILRLGSKCCLCEEKATWNDKFNEKGIAYCDMHFPERICECEICKEES